MEQKFYETESINSMTPQQRKIDISVVIPVYNEEENVTILQERTQKVLDEIGRPYEIVFVDDGSSDRTFEILAALHDKHKPTVVVKFRANFGQSAAMAAGFEAAKGDIVVAMDGDLQNDPADIPRMLDKLDEGYDVVAGWRKNRKDKLIMRKVPSKIANRIICSVTGVSLHDTGCSLKVFRRCIIKRIRLYGELHRFIPALARIEGARITEMAVNHHERQFGVSKYNITRTFRVIMDLMSINLFMRHLQNPIRFFGKLGAFSILCGMFALVAFLFQMCAGQTDPSYYNVLLTVAFVFMGGGFGFISLGLLANLISGTGKRKHAYLAE